MSIHFGDRRSGGWDGDFDSARIGRQPGKATDQQLEDLVDAIASAAQLDKGATRKVGPHTVEIKVNVNGSEYDVKVKSDGVFSATRSDGAIEISLRHDPKVWGSPLELTYINHSSPNQSGVTKDGSVCAKAQAMARRWYEAATKKPNLDI